MGESAKVEKNTEKKGKSYSTFMKDVFDGTILTKGFISRNFKMIIIIVAGVLFYIGNHYKVIMCLNKIDELNVELTDVKYEALTQSSLLMRESRQSNVRKLVVEKGLELEESTQPPFVVEIKE
jgi:hypothetical protein